MQGVYSQAQPKEISGVLEVKDVVLGINGKGLVAGGAAGVTSVGGAQRCASHSCFKYLNLYICIYTHIYIIKMHLSKILGGSKESQMCTGRKVWSE